MLTFETIHLEGYNFQEKKNFFFWKNITSCEKVYASMYISSISIKNFRCFENIDADLNPHVNVLIGENNSGKSNFLRAFSLLFNRRRKLNIHDFYQGYSDFSKAPVIEIKIKITSSESDSIDDEALVASWLVRIDSPWEAQLTYRYFLPDEYNSKFELEMKKKLEENSGLEGIVKFEKDKKYFWSTLNNYMDMYISRIYGGNIDSLIRADVDLLEKFDVMSIDAIRDVDSELLTGDNKLLKEMLYEILDSDIKNTATENNQVKVRTESFSKKVEVLMSEFLPRLNIGALFDLISSTGANECGELNIDGKLYEEDIINSLKLYISQKDIKIPINYNGLGYNNLIYISLILSISDFKTNFKKFGPNAVVYPILLIEEPEAHLHPALQYKLLKYILNRSKTKNRQIFITTHSTQVTSAVDLDYIICFTTSKDKKIKIAYPGKTYGKDLNSQKSKRYVERYLDATKSNMLFSKGVIFVEGISELILTPCFAQYVTRDKTQNILIDKHIAVISVEGSNFKHFLPLFGSDRVLNQYALDKKVSCILDADPSRKNKTEKFFESCYPYQLGIDNAMYDYKSLSTIVTDLNNISKDATNIKIFNSLKTFEYDLSLANMSEFILTSKIIYKGDLLKYLKEDIISESLISLLKTDKDEIYKLLALKTPSEQKNLFFSTYYYLCAKSNKAENAQELEYELNINIMNSFKEQFNVPAYICEAIKWSCE